MKIPSLFARAALLALLWLPPADAAEAPLPLVPWPAHVERGSGQFTLTARTPVRYSDPAARAAAERFVGLAAASPGLALAADDGRGRRRGIEFRLDPDADAAPESYSLVVDAHRIVVSARDPRGLFHGATTLWQLLSADADGTASVPALRIDDAPRFAWRGLMLDSARHMQSVDEIKQLLDTMALHKLNTFHWHLTDDQGWRVEIKRYPRLTEIGGCRVPMTVAGTPPAARYCGFYTQDQIRDVVAYAAARQITVVPELDMPGHAQAAVAAYPELGVTGAAPPVSPEWGVHKYLFNPDEATLTFLENVIGEMLPLFPGPYFHVGGDEAVKDQWKASAAVQARMKELGVADETALQSWFIHRLETFLAGHGKRLIGWDEILEGGLPEEATVMSWRGTEGGLEAASEGHDVVMAPSSELYLDYLQTDSPDEPPGRPATIPLAQVYAFEPVPAALAADKRAHILGVQANAWTEHMRDFGRVQRAVLPRMAALAEVGWSPQAARDWNGFLARLPAQLAHYRALGIGYAATPFEVRSALQPTAQTAQVAVTLSNGLGYDDIRYTLDGSDPTAASTAYAGPFTVRWPVTLKAALFDHGTAMAAATTRRIDAASWLSRTDEELQMCTGALMLRLEDDGPAEGPRAIYNVDIFNPCWSWKAAPLAGIGTVRVRAGRIPYAFQLAGDEKHRRFLPAKTAHGEVVLRDGCEGEVLATQALPAATDADGFVTLDLPVATTKATADLCVVFTGDTRPDTWVLDRITLRPE